MTAEGWIPSLDPEGVDSVIGSIGFQGKFVVRRQRGEKRRGYLKRTSVSRRRHDDWRQMETFSHGQIHPSAVISSSAAIGAGVTIGAFTVVHDGVELGDGAVVGSHCSLGEPAAEFYDAGSSAPSRPCVIGDGAVIRSHAVLYEGVTIGTGLRTGHRVTVREGTVIGDGVQIGTMSDLQGDLTIGDYVRLHSNVHLGQLSTIEDFVWLFPYVVLTNDPHPPSDTCMQGPTVRRFAVVATNSILMPGVEIGEHALVGAMSLVTKDVPAETVVVGVPAKPAGSVRDVRCKHGVLEAVYPWPQHFRRGYPEGVLPPAEDERGLGER